MKWRLDHNGDYIKAGWLIEHAPKRNAQKPFYLFSTNDPQEPLTYVDNFETLDIAKRNAK